MPSTETVTQSVMPIITANLLCPDFLSRRSDYEEQIVPFLEKNRTTLQLEQADDILEAYIEKVWPHDLPGSMIMAYASFDDFERFILRPPVDGPLAEGFAVDGLVPIFGAYRKQATLVVDRCILTAHIPPRPFEQYVSGQILTVISDQRMQQADFDMLAQLPRIHEKAKQHLHLWLECLDWQEKLTFIRQQDFRYEKVMVGDDGLIRFMVKDHKTLHKLKCKRNTFMMVASLTDSQNADAWQPVQGARVFLQRIGKLEKIQFVDPDKLPFEIDENHRLREQKLAIIIIRPEEDMLQESIPEEGFLLTSVGGDLKPIRSMRNTIQRFMRGQGHNWFLPYWLFDIQNAAAPTQIKAIYRHEQPHIPLNDQQRAAVEKALTAMDVMLLHGPPGTGKTECISDMCRQACRRGWRILLVSQANTAVDNAFLKLSKAPSTRPLRYGNPSRIETEARCFLKDNVLKVWFGSIRESCTQRTHQNRQLSLKLQHAQEALGQLASIEQQANHLTVQIERCQSDHQRILQSQDSLKQNINHLHGQRDICQRYQQALNAVKNWFSCTDNTVVSMELVTDELLSQHVGQLATDIQKVFSIQSNLSVPGLTTPSQNPWSFLRLLRQAIKRIGEVELLTETMICQCQSNNSVSDHNWGQLCRQLQLSLIATFGTASLTKLEELIASLNPSGQWLDNLSHMKTFCQIIAGPVQQMLDHGFERIADQINLLLAKNEANNTNYQEQLQDLLSEKDRIDTEEINASQKISGLDQQLTECRQKWQQIWPIACVEMETPDLSPSISKDAMQQRQQQLQHWLDDRHNQIQRQQQWDSIRKKWLNLLAQPSAAENPKLLEMYVSLANVVGVTCLEAGQRSFYESEEFEPFDLVIVDEVSKAMPIELLMPMMLGRRVILVGDHRQLPPMNKERESSYTEALEEGTIQLEDFQRFKELITTSYFEQLFTNASTHIKQGLRINYRSHGIIVEVDNSFYNGQLASPDDIEAFNRTKQHHLTVHDRFGGKYIEPHQHVLWVDSSKAPNGRPFFEKQMGSSKVNILEISLVIANLELLNKAVKQRGYQAPIKAKVSSDQNGLSVKDWLKQKLSHARPETLDDILKRGKFEVNRRPATTETILKNRDVVVADTRMLVGVITFYGAQLGQIRQRITQLQSKKADALDCLDIKTNTVDKFQGMEMPIVIVSMVRAPRHKHLGQFVKEYRRINVAFSRAQKLLIVIGAANIFRPATIELPDMDTNEIKTIAIYETIYQLITQNGGRRYARQLINRF